MGDKGYFEVTIAGLGGQGALIIGQLLAEAAASRYRNISYFPNYAAAMRGGDSECTIILSDAEISTPAMLRPGTAIVMSAGSLQEFEKRVQPGGIVVIDGSLMGGKLKRDDLTVYELPATEAAIKLGNRQVANFILLGGWIEATAAVPLELVEEAVERRLAGGKYESLLGLNKQALREGARLVAEAAPQRQ